MGNNTVPVEVMAFFGEGAGKTLLVKGNPGAGKTIFAFTLLRELKKKGVYLSTRVDTESLYNHIGWLKENLPAENIIDATQSERLKLAGPTLIKPLKYSNVPDFLKGVYERTESHEHALVIIDSWDAVVSHTGYHEPREREKLEHNLCDFSRKTGTDIIFIAEYVEQKPLDYLVDGVVIATNIIREDQRRVRTLELQKLRGGPMKQPIYLYSLNGGVFNGFRSFQGYPNSGFNNPQPLPDINSERLSTGIKDLDNVINGYGNFNLCRGDRTAYDLLQLFFIVNAIGLGKRLCLPLSEISLLRKAKAFLPENPGDKLHVLQTENIDDLKKYVTDLNQHGSMPGTIFFKCLDNLNEQDNIESVILDINRHGGFVFGFISEGKTVSAELQSMAVTSLVVQMNFGVPCLYSNVPVTGLYAMSLDPADGCPAVTLTPIV